MSVASNIERSAASIVSEHDEQRALEWAGELGEIAEVKRRIRAPWGHAFTLGTGRDTKWLKIACPQTSVESAILPALAQRFPEVIDHVLASDSARGYLLLRYPDGTRLDYQADVHNRIAIVSAYASLQATCVDEQAILEILPVVDPAIQLSNLQNFLSVQLNDDTVCCAQDIVGRSAAERWAAAIAARQSVFEALMAQVGVLPKTLCHGDLRPPNASIRDSSVKLHGWENACMAPAGWSLHGLFSGCTAVVRLLAGERAGDSRQAREPYRVLNAYIDALVLGGYADRQTLQSALGAAACAGLMHYITGFSRYRFDDEAVRKDIAGILDKRLGDLLDVADYLMVGNTNAVLASAADHWANDRPSRAISLLRQHLRRLPNDAEVHAYYAELLHKQGSFHRARHHYAEVLDITPQHVDALTGLASLYLERLDYERAIRTCRKALQIDEQDKHALAHLELAFELRHAEMAAKQDDVLPRLVVSDEEFTNRRLGVARTALAEKMLLEYGTLILENVFDVGRISEWRDYFYERYAAYFDNRKHDDALRIGDRRFQVTIDIEGPYNTEDFIAHPLVMPLMHRWLDEKFVFGSATAAVSLPGSKEQWIHKDHPRIFSRRSESLITPPAGVSLMTPLVDVHEGVGTTKVKKRSHLVSLEKSQDLPSLSPYVNAGSCFFMDHRLSHKGEPNESQEVRPIINSLYHRRWFRDSLNFQDQPPIRVSAKELESMPSNLRRLLKWTRDPGPRGGAS